MLEQSKTRDALLERAIEYYHGWYPNTPGPISSIARLFGIDYITLKNQLQNQQRSIVGNGGSNQLLTPREEEGIIRYVYIQIYVGYLCTSPLFWAWSTTF